GQDHPVDKLRRYMTRNAAVPGVTFLAPIVLMLLFPSATAFAQTFDLVCTGEGQGPPVQFRIDLEQKTVAQLYNGRNDLLSAATITESTIEWFAVNRDIWNRNNPKGVITDVLRCGVKAEEQTCYTLPYHPYQAYWSGTIN